MIPGNASRFQVCSLEFLRTQARPPTDRRAPEGRHSLRSGNFVRINRETFASAIGWTGPPAQVGVALRRSGGHAAKP